jgi:cysteine desulfurase
MKKNKNNKKQIYLDYAATTPLDPRVFQKMKPYFLEKFGNTMSLHLWGQEAKCALEEAREKVASLIKARPDEIIFTGSATESNNLALKGMALRQVRNRIFKKNQKKGHLVISSIEHPCLMESAKWLENQGFEVSRIKVNEEGLIDPEDIKKAIKKETFLVSVIHASNEIGTIQPIKEIGKICREANVYFHTDAVQSFGKISINVDRLNIDLLTASSHKMYGPKGAACLYLRKGIEIEPILHGGGQEQGLRSSTVNLPAIVGFAEACEIAGKEMFSQAERTIKLRDKLIERVLEKIPGSCLNGSFEKRLPNNINFWFEGVEGEAMVVQLDLKGVAVSTGSACSSFDLKPSYTLLAIGLTHQQAHASLRISLGKWTKKSDIDYLLKVLPETIIKLRKISGNI